MKRIFFLIYVIFFCIALSAQELFESAVDSLTQNDKTASKVSLNGYVRGSVFGGGKTYDLASTFAEIAFKTNFEKGKTFLTSDIRLRKGFFFSNNDQTIQIKELFAGYRGNKFDVLLGNQIINWGRTDGFNPTNNITPNDYFFLSSNPDDQKESNFMLRLKYRIIPTIELELIGIPFYEASNYRYDLFEMDKNANFGEAVLPSKQLKNGTVAARINFDLPAAGFSLSYFNGYDPYHGFNVQSVDWSTGAPKISLASNSYKKTTLGTDIAVPAGNFILRGEVAYNITKNLDNKMYIPLSDVIYVAGIESDLGGITMICQYIGKFTPSFTDLSVPILSNPLDQLAQMLYANQMINYENIQFNRKIFYQQEKTNHAVSLTFSKSFGYETWNAEISTYYNFTSSEWLIRPKLTWKINDALSASLGGNYMHGKEKTLFGYSSAVMNGAFLELKAGF